MLTNAPSHPRNPSRRTASSANEPSRMETLPSPKRAFARRELGSRLNTLAEYFLSPTRARTIGMPCAPVPPMTKIFEKVWETWVLHKNPATASLRRLQASGGRPREIGLPAFGECRKGLACLRCLQALLEQSPFFVDLHRDPLVITHQLFGQAKRAGGSLGQYDRRVMRLLAQLALWRHGIGQAACECGGRIHRLAQRKHCVSARMPDPRRQ